MLDIVPHPHHQGLKDCFLVWDVDVVAGEQLDNLSRGEQQELLVLNDLQKVFLEDRGNVEEADNHQSLAEGYDRCRIVQAFLHQWHKDTEVTKENDARRQKTHSDIFITVVLRKQQGNTLHFIVSLFCANR